MTMTVPDWLIAVQASRREARAREERLRADLRAGLAGLPEPQHEYVIEAPQARSPLVWSQISAEFKGIPRSLLLKVPVLGSD